MGKYFGFILLGGILTALGIVNFRGNISTIHWYNRRRIAKEDTPKYGKCMGIASITIGGSFIITAILAMLLQTKAVEMLSLAGCIVGIIIMMYGQFKYRDTFMIEGVPSLCNLKLRVSVLRASLSLLRYNMVETNRLVAHTIYAFFAGG